MSKSWSLDDDELLIKSHLSKTENIAQLAVMFDRTEGGIRSRMKHLLEEPDHSAYERLYESGRIPEFTSKYPQPVRLSKKVRLSESISTVSNAKISSSSSSTSSQAGNTHNNVIPALKIDPTTLTATQLTFAQEIVTGRQNVFLTGAAGVGKSYLLRFVIQELKSKYPSEGMVAITAPTGIAATHINGQTIHSFAGVGLGNNSAEVLFEQLRGDAKARWRRLQCLVVDEISMLDSTLFDKLEYIARKCRGSSAVFGGVQLVFCGDFFQLPPVKLGKSGACFCFESLSWEAARIKRLELTEIIRQTGIESASFVKLLNEIRIGICTARATSTLAECDVENKPVPADGILPTKLYCVNRDVDAENIMFLDGLLGERIDFLASDDWKRGPSDPTGKRVTEDGMDKKAAKILSLKIGAQVNSFIIILLIYR